MNNACYPQAKLPHNAYFAVDKQSIFVEFEVNMESFEGEICVETQNALKEGLIDNNHENISVYLVLSGRRSRLVATQDLDASPLMRRARSISIPNSVEQLCENCISVSCWCVSRVTFGESSSLRCIGAGAFVDSPLPGSVEELCNECFHGCTSLSRVVFNESSSLKRISKSAFALSRLTEIQIPASVEELGASSFSLCIQRAVLVGADRLYLFSRLCVFLLLLACDGYFNRWLCVCPLLSPYVWSR